MVQIYLKNRYHVLVSFKLSIIAMMFSLTPKRCIDILKVAGSTLLLLLLSFTAFSQLAISNGVSVPTRDTVRVLIVFCEVDFGDGRGPSGITGDYLNGNWPKDENGRTQVPEGAHTYFDVAVNPERGHDGVVTGYYYEASFGQYVLLGDYLPEVVTVPCGKTRIGSNGLVEVLKILNKKESKNGTLYSKHGFALKDFDKWTPTPQGEPKIKEPDGMIDLVYLIWRNNRFLTSRNTFDNSGFGVTRTRGVAFQDMEGVNNVTSYNCGGGYGNSAINISIAEHLHGIFGGNHWHSAGGRGFHTFLVPPGSYGLTGQQPASMQAVSGWDRWMMKWKNPEKKYVTSALDEYGNEVRTDSITIETHPEGGVYELRDFVTTGDALMVKLPHIDWQEKGDVKNQYLWVENRRMITRFDEYIGTECADRGDGKYMKGTPGLYMYLQVGKDKRQGGREIYSAQLELPNGQASPFFPLTAEGQYDFHYLYDNIMEGQNVPCSWNNANVPIDVEKSLPNPFCGYSDLYRQIDSNFDGKLYSGDRYQTGLAEKIGDTIVWNYHGEGDWEDVFCEYTGKTRICLSTNPAPVPQYTYAANIEFNQFNLRGDGKLASFENRTTWLNGLIVEIIEENEETGAIKVRLAWDDYNIRNDVRWCGNIKLSPHDFDVSKPSLLVWEKQEVWLDQGLTPTYHEARFKDEKGNYVFADSTVFTALENSYIHLEPKSRLVVDNGSTLVLKKGSKLVIGKKACVILKNGGKLVREDGAEVIMRGKGRIKDKNRKSKGKK